MRKWQHHLKLKDLLGEDAGSDATAAAAGRTVELTVDEAGLSLSADGERAYVILSADPGTGVLSARYVEDPA